jgi:hypothetical protein
MKTVEFYEKTANYWQAVLRVGFPTIALYRATNYLIFRVETGNTVTAHYPWRFSVIMDVITILILSTLWWSLMRSSFGKQRTNEGRRDKRES